MDKMMVSAINTKIKTQFGHEYISAASTLNNTSEYLPGGVVQLIHRSSAGRHHSMGKDPLAKFAWTILWGGNGRLLFIITAYRFCQTKGTTLIAINLRGPWAKTRRKKTP